MKIECTVEELKELLELNKKTPVGATTDAKKIFVDGNSIYGDIITN